MSHMLLEVVPFLLGTAFGYRFSGAGVSRGVGPSLIIGLLSALLAGELTPNLSSSIASVLADSAGALAGWMLVRLARRQAV